jgi:uncharacterized protein YecE (DUF72 family)
MPEPITCVGTAGWSIPQHYANVFDTPGKHLARYGARLAAVEINSSFYRPHKPETYARWAASVPDSFRFAVKVPREITHSRKLMAVATSLKDFLGQVSNLGDRLGPLLVQLPPSFRYDKTTVTGFFEMMRAKFDGGVVCEPRHASWFTDDVDEALRRFKVARVAADPAPAPRAAQPGGWPGLVYRRLHGSPKMYYSAYSAAYLKALARDMRASAAPQWCIFDNTAVGAALGNALELQDLLRKNNASAAAMG